MTTRYAGIRFTQFANTSMGRLIVRGASYASGTVNAYLMDADHEKPVQTFYADYETFTDGDGKKVWAAVFPTLPAGNYKVSTYACNSYAHDVTIYPGDVRKIRL